MAIKRSKERIDKTGEIFTPIPLVNEILDKMPVESFKDPTKTFIDPACGDGNFLVEVLKRKLQENHDPKQAISSIYGIDLMQDNVVECKKRLLSLLPQDTEINSILDKNIVCADTLKVDFNSMFE
jgi:type I restriction-modification system DNA methylase subunit